MQPCDPVCQIQWESWWDKLVPVAGGVDLIKLNFKDVFARGSKVGYTVLMLQDALVIGSHASAKSNL